MYLHVVHGLTKWTRWVNTQKSVKTIYKYTRKAAIPNTTFKPHQN